MSTSFAYSQDVDTSPIPVQEELIELEGPNGQKFLVNKKNLIPIESKEDTPSTEQIIKQTLEQTKSQNIDSKSNIQINVDAKKYFNNVNNTTTNKSESSNLEIKDNTESTINATTTSTDTTAIEKEASPGDSNNELDIKTGIETRLTEGEETVEQKVRTEIKAPSLEVETKVEITETPATDVSTPDEDTTVESEVIIDESDTESDDTMAVSESAIFGAPKFSVKGTLGYGKYTTISDVDANYSFGLSLGYDLNDFLTLELQYIFTEYQDTYNFGYYGYGSTYEGKFNQNDLGLILNYNVLSLDAVKLMARGGLNFSHRSHRDYYGYSESASAFLVMIGGGLDIRLLENLYFTSHIDYNLNISGSKQSYGGGSLLDLVAGESYANYNLGLKFKF